MQIFIFFVVWPILLAVVLNPRQPKTPLRHWLSILLPPLVLLIVLLMFPYHRYTMHFIWSPAMLALYVSIGSAGIRFIMAVSHVIAKSSSAPSVCLGIIRPILVIAVVGGLIMRNRIALRSVEDYAKELAGVIQQSYDPNLAYPEILSAWKMDENNPTYSRCFSSVNRYGLRIPMRYENIKSAGKFNVSVSHFGFGWSDFKGGRGWPLEYPPYFNTE